MLNPKRKLFKWGPIEGAILPIYFSAKPGMVEMRKIFKMGWPETILIFQGRTMLWLNDDLDLLDFFNTPPSLRRGDSFK